MLRFFNLIFCVVIFSSLFGMVYNNNWWIGGRQPYELLSEPSITPVDVSGINYKWIVQKLDNFDPNNNKTWFNVSKFSFFVQLKVSVVIFS